MMKEALVIFLIAIPVIGIPTFVVFSIFLAHSPFVVKRFVNKAFEEAKCKDCTAGTQVLIDRDGVTSWGPIPEALRIVRRGKVGFGSRHANARACTTCAGLGTVSKKIPNQLSEFTELP